MLLSWKMICLSSGFFRFKFDTRKASSSPCMYATSIAKSEIILKSLAKMVEQHDLGVGFKYFLFSPLLGEMIQFD